MGTIALLGNEEWQGTTLFALTKDGAFACDPPSIRQFYAPVEVLRHIRREGVDVLVIEATADNCDLAAALVPLLGTPGGSLDQIILAGYDWDALGKPPAGVTAVDTSEQLVLAAEDSLRHADAHRAFKKAEKG